MLNYLLEFPFRYIWINTFLDLFLDMIIGSILIVLFFIIPIIILSKIFQKISPFKQFNINDVSTFAQITFIIPFITAMGILFFFFIIDCMSMNTNGVPWTVFIKYYFLFILLCATPMFFLKK